MESCTQMHKIEVSRIPLLIKNIIDCLIFLLGIASLCASASNTVFFGGAGFASNSEDIANAYPFSYRIYNSPEKELKLNSSIRSKISTIHNSTFEIGLNLSENNDSQVVFGFVVDREAISEEKIGDKYKLVIDISAQSLFFDYQSKAVLASYPIAIQYIDISQKPFSDSEKASMVEKLYYGGLENNINILDEFSATLTKIKFSREVRQRVKVTNVNVDPEALPILFPSLNENSTKIFVAQQFSKYLSNNQSIPVLPFTVGQAIGGKMVTRLSGTEYSLVIPAPDFAIELTLKPFKKIKFAENNTGASWIYGSYLGVDVIEPDSQKSFLSATLKYGATKSVPQSQTVVDDRAAYEEALLILIDNFTRTISSPDEAWAKRYASDPAIANQMKKLNEVLKKCAM